MLDYSRPDNLEDVLLTLTEQPCILLAGGTDTSRGAQLAHSVLSLIHI